MLLGVIHFCYFTWTAIWLKVLSIITRFRWQWHLWFIGESPDRINADVQGILKRAKKPIPGHISIAVEQKQTRHITQLAKIIYWFTCAGFPCVSIFDCEGETDLVIMNLQ